MSSTNKSPTQREHVGQGDTTHQIVAQATIAQDAAGCNGELAEAAPNAFLKHVLWARANFGPSLEDKLKERGWVLEAEDPPQEDDAVAFLEQLRPRGPWVLTAIVPDGEISTITAQTPDRVRKFLQAHDGQRNLYYSVNPTKKLMTSKAAKTDIAAVEYLLSDLDPKPDETAEAAKARYLAALKGVTPKPTAVVDSGNGIQVLWKLAEPINLKGLPSPAMKAVAEDVEGRTKLLMETLGGTAGTQNIDRILRIPGTVNLPNKKKRGEGRVACPTKLVRFNGTTCKLEDFPAPKAKAKETPHGEATSERAFLFREEGLTDELKALVRDGVLDGATVPVGERSEQFYHAVGWLKQLGWPLADIIKLLDKYPGGIAAKYGSKFEREARRAYDKADAPPQDNATGQPPPNAAPPPTLIEDSAAFAQNFVPPDYLIDGMLQKRFLYSMTAPTGAGKTCIAMLIAAHVALGLPLDGKEIEKGRVLFFAGENPDDVRMRWIKQCELLGREPADMDVCFLPYALALSDEAIRKRIDAEAAERGPFSLLIVDTSAAYFRGDDENSNVQLGNHARTLRSFVNLPGGPSIIVTAHPPKTPTMDNLLPRGGGAFLNEVDGNLVCMKDGMTVELHWHGKFRGPDFAPILFKLQPGTTEKLKDSKGRPIWTVTAAAITEAEQAGMAEGDRRDEDDLLVLLHEQPDLSLAALAERLAWLLKDGRPNKGLVHRTLAKLLKDKLVERKRGKITLTKAGEAIVNARQF